MLRLLRYNHLVESSVNILLQTLKDNLRPNELTGLDKENYPCLYPESKQAKNNKGNRCWECMPCCYWSLFIFFNQRCIEALVKSKRQSLDAIKRRMQAASKHSKDLSDSDAKSPALFKVSPTLFLFSVQCFPLHLNYHPGILIRSASLPFPAAMTLLSICRVCIFFFHLLFLCFSVCCLPPFLLILLPPTLLSSSRLSFSLLFFFAERFVICLLPRLCFFIFFFSTVFFSHYLSCSSHLLISSHLPVFLPLSTRSLTFFFPLFNPLR